MQLGWAEEIEFQNQDTVTILKESKIIKEACMKKISVQGTRDLPEECPPDAESTLI